MANLILLVVVEYLLASDFVIHYDNGESRFMDLAFGYVANLVVCYFISVYFKKKLVRKNKELEKLNNSKTLLFNIIAHDLRAPLNNVLGFTNIMNDKSESLSLEKFQKYSEIANRESINASALLDSLLEWGKIHMDKVQINSQPINLYQTTCEIIDVFKNKLDEKEIEIGIQIPEEFYVSTDLDIIKTIMRNLVSNAIKFTPHGGNIIISAEVSNSNYITIIVKDNGIGMNKEMIENLFLFQIKTNRKGTDGEASNGLGLIITKELIEKQGGELTIESQNNQGSAFKFTVLKSNRNTN